MSYIKEKGNARLKIWIANDLRLLRFATNTLLIVFVMALALLFLPWIQTAPGHGRVIALNAMERRSDLSSPLEGRIQRWYFNEGQKVKKGEVILEITDNDPMILHRLEMERSALKKRLDAAVQGEKTSQLNLDRQSKLFKQGLSARRTYELAQLELARYESDVAAAQAELARIDVRLARQEQQKIVAPNDGTLVRIYKNAGEGTQYVKSGDTLATLVPDTESRAVELYIRGNDIPLVGVGRKVLIQFEGWPTVMFSGWPDLAVGTFRGKVEFIDALDDGHGNFRVVVSPEEGETWPPPQYLRQGMRAVGWILLGRVKLGFELWRQFNGFPNSYVPHEQENKTK